MIDKILNILGIGTGRKIKIMPLPRGIGKPKANHRTEADIEALHKASLKRHRKNIKRAQNSQSHTV